MHPQLLWHRKFSRFQTIQYKSIEMASNINRFIFTRIMKRFPTDIHFAFAYGSGVFQQTGNANPDNMIDLVFAINQPRKWHSQNLKKNPAHYSGMRILGPKAIAAYQTRIGAGVYYNTLVKCEKQLIKYGVVEVNTLVEDLNEWKHLYISGRLQKPVYVIKRDNLDSLSQALQNNLRSALRAALLLLPESFSEEELYCTIAGLSYQGDFRMTFGENKDKVRNIVLPNLDRFREYYKPFIEEASYLHWNDSTMIYQQDASPACIYDHLQHLPSHLRQVMLKRAGHKGSDMEEVFSAMSKERNHSNVVNQAIKEIVFRSSRSQSIKAIPAAGITKTIKYSAQKVLKMWTGGKGTSR